MFLFGTASVGRCSISFLYLMELLPKAQQVLVGTSLQVMNSLVIVIACVYFSKISKNWIWLEIIACILGVISMVGCYFLPESPKFLISRKRYNEARAAINWIAKFNCQREQFNSQFDREVIDRKTGMGWGQSDASSFHSVEQNNANCMLFYLFNIYRSTKSIAQIT